MTGTAGVAAVSQQDEQFPEEQLSACPRICRGHARLPGWPFTPTHERQAYGNSLGDAECAAISAILDRLQAAGRAEARSSLDR
jgi:hypothetical protein